MKNKYVCILINLLLAVALMAPAKSQAKTQFNNTIPTMAQEKALWITILVDINEKTLYVVSNDKIVKKYPIAPGKHDSPSPLGDFQITEKRKSGDEFGAAWLGLDVPWGNYGIHGTNQPGSIGYYASHGCIRMLNTHITELYKIVDVGTPVKIIGGLYGLFGNGYRTLIPGDRGGDVLIVQKRLKEQGYYSGKLSGVYGVRLEIAVNKYQQANGLPVTNRISPGLYKKLGLILFE